MNCNHCWPIWSEHSTQQKAFDLFDKTKKQYPRLYLILLCREIDASGKRRYLMTTCEYFYLKYRNMHPEQRYWYEIIRYDFPCKLYFDIEYNKQLNKSNNGDKLISIFKQFLIKYIHTMLQISISKENIVDLDSSNVKKFSRHIIINFKDKLFKNNIECGAFVANMCDKIINIITNNKNDPLNQLMVNNIYNKKGLFIDKSVYYKNRCFRLPFSSKLKYIQQKTPYFLQPINQITNKTMKYEQFVDMLVCQQPNNSVEFITINKTKFNDNISNVKYNHSKQNTKYLNGMDNDDNIKIWIKNIISKNLVDINRKIKLDLYKIYYEYDNMILLYHVQNYRYCENISREHKSNNVYFIINYNESLVFLLKNNHFICFLL